MTVIASVISKYCTAHATDSLITKELTGGGREVLEWEQSKIVSVKHFRGAMAYWGLASCDDYQWSTFDWLREMATAAQQYSRAEDFARSLAQKLTAALSRMPFAQPLSSGIGIHFTAYERVKDYWIPELFQLTNYTDPSYQTLYADGIHVTRETYNTLKQVDKRPEHREPEYRLEVHEFLHTGGIFQFNNGDPVMFNGAANAISTLIKTLTDRGILADPDNIETYRQIAQMPVEIVAHVQKKFTRSNTRVVGGRIHDLLITPNSLYSSTSGDAP